MRTIHSRLGGAILVVVLLCILAFGTSCSKQARSSRYLESANRYYEQQQYEKARLEYVNVLKLTPKHPLALQRLGTILYDAGQLRQALAVLLQAAEVAPDDLGVAVQIARILLISGDLAAARQQALAVLEKQPGNEQAILILSDASLTAEQMNETDRRLRQLQQQVGATAALHVALGNLALRQGEVQEAEKELAQAQVLAPQLSVVHLALGNLRWRQGKFADADNEFQKAAELTPRDWAARLRWADFRRVRGQTETARQTVEEITRQAPQHIPALLCLARIAFAEKKFDESRVLASRVLESNPADGEALLVRAHASLGKGDLVQAIAELEQVRDRFPKAAQIHYQLALAYVRNQSLPKASASLQQALVLDPKFDEAGLLAAELDVRQGNHRAAAASLSKLLARAPKLERAYPVLVEAFRGQGQLDQALLACQQWKELSPAAPQAHYVTGLLLRQQQKDTEARNAFDAAVELAPDFLLAIEQLVDLDLREKSIPSALRRAQQLVDRHPQAAAPLLLLGKVHLAQQNSEEAEAALLRALERDPQSSAASMLLAQLYIRSQKRDQALERLRLMTVKNPKDISAWFLIASIEHESKQFARAREAYEKVLSLNPKVVPALNNLAYLCAENLEDSEAAYRYAKTARELAPEDPAVADTWGWVLCQRREYAWALPVLREAAEKQPSQPEILFHLGTVYYLTGDADAARLAFQRACASGGEFPSRAKAERRLWILDLEPRTAGPESAARLKDALAEQPRDTIALLRLAAIAERDGAVDQAFAHYRGALEASPKSIAVNMALARFYAESMHNPAKALEHGKVARDLAPEDPTVAHAAARFAYQARDYKRAYSLLQESARKRSQDPEIVFDLALATYARGLVPEAAQAARRALDLNASFPRADAARQFLDLILLAENPAGDQHAQSRIQKILEEDRECIPALMVDAQLRQMNRQIVEAKDVYENRILKVNPDFAPAWRQLAFLYGQGSADDERAFKAGMKAREVLTADPELTKLLGEIAYRRKNYAQSVQLLKETAQNRPRDAEVWHRLGLAHIQLNQKDPGRAALQKALTSNPDSSLAAEVRSALEELK